MYETEIINGVVLLDKTDAKWRDKINLKTLVSQSLDDCVLAQVFGDYPFGLDRLGISIHTAHKYGFDIDTDELVGSYRELTDAWKEYLAPNLLKETIYANMGTGIGF